MVTSTILLLVSFFQVQPNGPLVLTGAGQRALGLLLGVMPSDLGPLGRHPLHPWIFWAPPHAPLVVMDADLHHWTNSPPICNKDIWVSTYYYVETRSYGMFGPRAPTFLVLG